jgi:hypothetical protein
MQVLFEERQKFRQRWLWLTMLLTGLPILALLGAGVWQQLFLGRPFGTSPVSDGALVALHLLIGGTLVGTWLLLWLSRLTVTVTREEVVIVFRPFHLRGGKHIAVSAIAEAKARSYQPLREYGGWGIRFGIHGRAYNVSGDQGVQLVLKDGGRILIGSLRSEELEAAIAAARTSA